ncbi:hypothetical protein NLI96_g11042 [Meripilus lineatus]|uniref:Major facilitator superfamily (MFS) profile domain-containing protein n=1 Tax=Meripilus lineatus TaxID=2056292 RepID=A0AAD5USU3_9APHY|nr:hypothetical protein NLI96_g11042 [Physisporinus lineatus]
MDSADDIQIKTISDVKLKLGQDASIGSAIVQEKLVDQTEVQDEPEFREGGTQAWLTVLGGWFAVFATFGYANAFGIYQDLYTRQGAASASRISWVGSTQIFFLIASGLPAGKLFDMGYCRETALFGSLLYVFSMFMLSLAHPDKYYQIFLCQGVGMGIGAGFLYLPAMAIQSHHWNKKRPLAMGIVISGSSTGGIVYPIMLNQLVHGSVGFAWGVRASAFLTLGVVVLANIFMIPRPPKAKPHNKPRIGQLFLDFPYVLLIIGAILVMLGLFFPYFYLQLYAIVHGVDSTLAFYSLAIMNGSSILGRILPNLLAQKIGLYNTFVPISFCTGALIFALYGVKNAGGTVVIAVIYGFFSGAWLAVSAPTAASMAKDPSEVGVRMGLAFAIAAFGALIGAPIDGKLLGEAPFDWSSTFLFSGVIVLGGSAVLLVARFMVARRKGISRV